MELGWREAWTRAWPVLLAASTVTAVGVPAAVASYRHASVIVERSGDRAMAGWLPLSVDGMLLAALVVIWVRRHRGDNAGAFPWLAFGAGMLTTLSANLAAADPTPEGWAVAVWPPLALAITLELVALVASGTSHRTIRGEVETVGEAITAGHLTPLLPVTSPHTGPEHTTAPATATPAHTTPEVAEVVRDEGDQSLNLRDPLVWAVAAAGESGEVPGWRRIGGEFPDLTEYRAKETAKQARARFVDGDAPVVDRPMALRSVR